MREHTRHEESPRSVGDFFPDKRRTILYLRRCWSVATDAAVLLAVIILITAAGLYVCRIVWNLYLATYMGEVFVSNFPDEAAGTSQFLQMNFMAFSIRITMYAFLISVMIGSVFRFFNLNGRLYDPFGFLGRTLICGLPMAFLVAYWVQPIFGFAEWGTAVIAVLFPTLCVYGSCFDYAKKLLPVYSDVKKLIDRILRK